MSKITYYIGAGASYYSLPLYNDFSIRLSVYKDYIFHYQNKKKDKITKDKFSFYMDKLEILIGLLNSNQNTSLDILAHELFENPTHDKRLSFHQLKYLINDFFLFEQLKKQKINYLTQIPCIDELEGFEIYNDSICTNVSSYLDRRYKTFILPNRNRVSKKFDENINFISWNYDLQLEMAYAEIAGQSIEMSQIDLQVFPSPATCKGIDLKISSIIKLNGTCCMYYSSSTSSKIENTIEDRNFIWQDSYLDWMNDIFYNNSSRILGGKPFFKFYFEDQYPLNSKAVEYANEIMKETEILVVIGYSFHPSNREIDKKVFENSDKIKKVIFQTRKEDYENVKYNFSNIKSMPEESIKLFPNMDNFPPPNNI
jgi:hypothetical protein